MSQIQLIEVKPGIRFDIARLKQMLPDIDTLLFFGKLYELDAGQLGYLVHSVLGQSDTVTALLGSGQEHSIELQDYLIDLGYISIVENGLIDLTDTPPQGEILPELWKSLEVQVAKSVKDVADKLKDVIVGMPGKEGQMLFQSMAAINARRPVIGDYRATIKHAKHPDNLVILDVSGSMTEPTVQAIVEDVVALSYMADAHLAIVSETCTHWKPGEFSVKEVLAAAEYAGTHYEELAPLFDREWGVVVTIADYDSSFAAMGAFSQVIGHVDTVLDISLVARPTFLSEVIGSIADEVRPLLVAVDNYSLR